MNNYQLLDSGDLQKLEQFGPVRLIRPCPVAIWNKGREETLWNGAQATFSRDNKWHKREANLSSWQLNHGGIKCKISLGDFGNVGLFPEHASHWDFMSHAITEGQKFSNKQIFALNLFGYTGSASLIMAKAGALVCHVDASKPSTIWARENAQLNGLGDSPIRWIVDDALAFVEREIRRGRKYDAILLDPPTFGRGPKGESFKIEQHLPKLLSACQELLTDNPLFLLLTCHTPGLNHIALHHLMKQHFRGWKGVLETGEMNIESELPLPAGSFARWSNERLN